MNNRGDIEFALRLRTDLEQGQRELQGLAQSVENVGAAATTSSAQLAQVGESADQQAARIRAMVEASLQQQAAANGMADSIQLSATATQEATGAWQQNAAAQTDAINAYHNAERAAESKAQADLKAAEAAKVAAASVEKESQELQQLLGKIDPVIRKLDELDNMEQQLRSARASGRIDLDTYTDFNNKLQEQRARVTGAGEAMRAGAISAGQYQQAMRQLPMQITDITTSLASGMPIWLVAVQQGGQIKDSFGGWANAGRALVSTINPLTLAIAGITLAAGATIAAFVQGAAETYEYEKAIALTGNSAGVSADRLAMMAQQIDAVSGTQRQAASALAEVTAAGKFTAEQIELIATTAVVMENAIGRSVGNTVDEFKRLADEPAAASAALNEQYNYLTVSVYEQIAALESQGDAAGAAQLAMEELGRAMQSRAAEISGHLGLIESAWEGIKNVAAEAWDAMLDVGRTDTLEDKLAAIQRQRQTAMYGVRGDRVGGSIDPALEARLQAEEEGIRREMELDAKKATQVAADKAANREAIAASAERSKAAAAFVKGAESQLQSLQNLTNVQRAQQVMQEQSIEANSELGQSMLAAAAATDKQKAANVADAEAKRQATQQQRQATQAQREAERASEAALRAAEQTTKQQLSYVQGLEEQATKLDMTSAEVRQYELAEKGLTGAMLDRAQAALVLLEAEEQQRQAAANASANAGLEAEFLRAAGRETDAALLEIRTKFDGMRSEFEKAGNEAGLAWLDKLIPVSEAKVRVDDVQREMDRILAEQQRQEQSVNVQQDAGLITELQARERILEIHRNTYDQLQQIRPVLADLAQQPGAVGEAAAQALAALDAQAQQLQATTSLLQETLRDGLTSGFTEALTGLANGTMTLREAVSALGQSVLDAMTQLAAENLAQSLTSGVMGLFSGGGGNGSDTAGMTAGAAAVTGSAGALSVAGGTLLTGAAAIQAAAASLAAANGISGVSSAAGSAGGSGGGGGWASMLASVGSLFLADGGHVRGPGTTTSDSIPAYLSDYEFVTRAAVVTQPGALDFLNDFNARGMAALDNYRVRHNTGGLAGVPAPALPSPGLTNTRLAEPAKSAGATLNNKQNFYLVDDPSRIGDVMSGPIGNEAIAVAISREPGKFRQILGLNN